MSIVSEALLKFLLFDIPIRNTIEKCNDVFRFQIINHLGSTYEKMVQEPIEPSDAIKKLEKEYDDITEKTYKDDLKVIANSKYQYLDEWCKSFMVNYAQNRIRDEITALKNQSGQDIVLQKNNRIYAGKKPSGNIVKVKPNGRRDSLANCPQNPIVDNANQCTIDDINKEWYIEFAEEKANDFLGIKRLENYKKDELLELANNEYHLNIDKKTKKDELIKIIKNYKNILTNKTHYDNILNEGGEEKLTKQELEEKLKESEDNAFDLAQKLQKSLNQNETLMNMVKEKEKEKETMGSNNGYVNQTSMLLNKINEFRKNIRKRDFIFDKELPSNLGGGEYYSINQIYDAIQEESIKVGLDFSFDIVDIISFDKDCIKISGKAPIHLATVKCIASFTDIDTGVSKTYTTIGQGSDTIDKAVSGATTMALRTWFYKNFTPKNGDDETCVPEETEKSSEPKIPVYIPEQRKAEIIKEVVKQEQHEDSDEEDAKTICENIMKVREKLEDSSWGEKTLEKLMTGNYTSVDLMEYDLKIKNKMEKIGL